MSGASPATLMVVVGLTPGFAPGKAASPRAHRRTRRETCVTPCKWWLSHSSAIFGRRGGRPAFGSGRHRRRRETWSEHPLLRLPRPPRPPTRLRSLESTWRAFAAHTPAAGRVGTSIATVQEEPLRRCSTGVQQQQPVERCVPQSRDLRSLKVTLTPGICKRSAATEASVICQHP